jgi:hypothetical protein
VQVTPRASESTAINWQKYARLLNNFSCQQTNFENVHKISYFVYFVDVYKIRRPALSGQLCIGGHFANGCDDFSHTEGGPDDTTHDFAAEVPDFKMKLAVGTTELKVQ